jgi:phospholipase D1/2
MPAFENAQLFNPNGFVTRLTLEYQYQALVRGSDSILGHLASVLGKEKAEEVFKTHMVVCGLRQIDTWPDGTVLTEQLYIHSKVMIVDDRFAIIGSANINDRSMLGYRDSEIAVVIEDPLFALHLRQDLWREHFGLIKSHEALTIRSDYPEVQDSLRSLIRQPASDACFDLWRTTAADNALIYRDLFGVVPCDSVRTRADFEKRMIANVTRPRVRLGTPEAERLSNLVGRVVELPLRFLEGEASLQDPMPTTASLCPKEVFS